MLINADITVYNKYVDPTARAEKYQRAFVPGVAWQGAKAVFVSNVGMVKADSVTVYVPFQRGANYVKPIAWQALTDKADMWTLQAGDVVVRGFTSDEITDAFTMANLKAKYDDALTITTIDPMDMGSFNLRHWRVGAK